MSGMALVVHLCCNLKAAFGTNHERTEAQKNIEVRVIKFKLRALKSPNDTKRHDQVRRDEQKYMYIAYNQLSWSFAKIGSVFERDSRTTKRAVESYKAIEQAAVASLDAEAVRSKQLRQIEHIRNLQKIAQGALDNLPDCFPDLENAGLFDPSFDSINMTLVKVFRRLTGDPVNWEDMAAHLGDEGKKIEEMSYRLDDVLPGGRSNNPDLTDYKKDLYEAWVIIKFGGLKTISEYTNPRKWEWEGLNPRCKNCPDQDYKSSVTIDDYM